MLNLKELLNKAYERIEKVPWENPEPPQELVEFAKSREVNRGRVLDIGCGSGHYSIYLAKKGFEVVGIDISDKAIEIAKKNAENEKVNVDFRVLDARNISQVEGKFDFIFEWGLLHFVMPEDRESYVKDVAEKLNSSGRYMVLTFNEQSPEWGGGKIRTGLTGAPVYYSSMDELKELYSPYLEIIEAKIRPTFFKNSGNEHLENYLLFRKIG